MMHHRFSGGRAAALFLVTAWAIAAAQPASAGGAAASTAPAASPVVDIGSRRELFVDRLLVDRLAGADLRVHRPIDAGTVLTFDKPWEGAFSAYASVIHDGDRYQLYYRGLPTAAGEFKDELVAYAESRDGVHWTKPDLDLFPRPGHPKTNIILADAGPASGNFAPFLDTRPDVPADQRYKALSGTRTTALWAYVSGDGVRWRKLQDAPVMNTSDVPFQNVFDSHNVSFWSPSEQAYVMYIRVLKDGIRRVARSRSTDYVHWTTPTLMEYRRGDAPAPIEQIYTNQTDPYFRAPHIYLAIGARFVPGRRAVTADQARSIGVDPKYANDLSDAVLMTTRGGDVYQRTFLDAFLRPGFGPENWVSRTNYPAWHIVQTGPSEMSLYVNQNYAQPTAHLRRYTLRLDGFASVHAGYDGGEMVTKPLTFKGSQLLLNFATSAAGGLRVEVQQPDGTPVPGFSLDDCPELIGNEIERPVTWRGGSVASLAGGAVRLRFVMKDADLFAIRFAGTTEEGRHGGTRPE